MKFQPSNIHELKPLQEHLDAGCPILKNRRRANYLIYESPDKSILECNALMLLGGKWFVWPKGLGEWVVLQSDKTVRKFAA